MPRGKKELAEQIIPTLREVEVEVGRGKPTTATPADLRQGVGVGHLGDQPAWNAAVEADNVDAGIPSRLPSERHWETA